MKAKYFQHFTKENVSRKGPNMMLEKRFGNMMTQANLTYSNTSSSVREVTITQVPLLCKNRETTERRTTVSTLHSSDPYVGLHD